MDDLKEHYGVIGFRVRLLDEKVNILDSFHDGVILFDDVLANACEIYDPSEGIFTVPVTGIWSLYFTGALSGCNDETEYSILAMERRTNKAYPYQPLSWMMVHAVGPPIDVLMTKDGSTHTRTKLCRGEQLIVRHHRGHHVLRGSTYTCWHACLEIEYPDDFFVTAFPNPFYQRWSPEGYKGSRPCTR